MSDDLQPAAADSRAILYSGHMVDAPGRTTPRFPPAMVGRVVEAIASRLGALWPRPGPFDTAIGSGACGSDLLFADALLAYGAALRLYLPFPPAEFVDRSVAFANADWAARFESVARRAQVLVATEALCPAPAGTDPYERTNLWMLDEARRVSSVVVFLCVWNGEGGDGPGGTQHMMKAVGALPGGDVLWIDPRTF